MDASFIDVQNVSRRFRAGGQDVFALYHVSLTIQASQLTILRGRSGSGKTTLLNIISALDRPTEGRVYLNGSDLTQMDETQRTMLRRKEMGFVFQSVALIPMMTAFENVEYALRIARFQGNRTERSMECLHMVGLSQRADHMPQELSGGEQQRVAIARAIAHKPQVIFADEPTGALDSKTGLSVAKIFKDLCEQEHLTVVMTTHDEGLMELAHTVHHLDEGKLVYD